MRATKTCVEEEEHLHARLESAPERRAVGEVALRAINEAPWWWDRLHEAIG